MIFISMMLGLICEEVNIGTNIKNLTFDAYWHPNNSNIYLYNSDNYFRFLKYLNCIVLIVLF